ncbi:MAG: metallophosphoesterase [Pseudomonadota bacterium]
MTQGRVAYFTDCHLGQRPVMEPDPDGGRMRYDHAPDEHGGRLRRVLDDIARRGVTSVVFGGDIGSRASVGSFFRRLKEHSLTPSIVLGNHDVLDDVTSYWCPATSAVDRRMCYSRPDGQWQSIFLDTSDNTVGEAQLAWLAGQLDRAPKVALFMHHPVLAIDTPVERAGAALRDRHKLASLLMTAGCEVVVFCGHYHMVDDTREANIRQLMSPAVSYQLVKEADRVQLDSSTFGYRLIDLSGDEITTEVVLFP